jgi:hypothetical protein
MGELLKEKQQPRAFVLLYRSDGLQPNQVCNAVQVPLHKAHLQNYYRFIAPSCIYYSIRTKIGVANFGRIFDSKKAVLKAAEL